MHGIDAHLLGYCLLRNFCMVPPTDFHGNGARAQTNSMPCSLPVIVDGPIDNVFVGYEEATTRVSFARIALLDAWHVRIFWAGWNRNVGGTKFCMVPFTAASPSMKK